MNKLHKGEVLGFYVVGFTVLGVQDGLRLLCSEMCGTPDYDKFAALGVPPKVTKRVLICTFDPSRNASWTTRMTSYDT